MGTNWLALSLPFFTTREITLKTLAFIVNPDEKQKYILRDRFDLISTISGAIVTGSFSGNHIRGRSGILPSMFVFSVLGAGLQTIVTFARHKRLEMALIEHNRINQPVQNARENNHQTLSEVFATRMDMGNSISQTEDPVRALFSNAKSYIESKVDVPEWASPLVNAVDINHRRTLNFRIEMLQDQINVLKKDIEKLELHVI